MNDFITKLITYAIPLGDILQRPLGGLFQAPHDIKEHTDYGNMDHNPHDFCEPETFKISTWNIFGLPISNNKWKTNLPQIINTIKTSDSDIFLIQEGFTKKHKKLFTEAGYPHAIQGPKPWSKIYGSGLWILSKHPITSYSFEPFDQSAGGDVFAYKGILQASIVLQSGKTIKVSNTHMQSLGKYASPDQFSSAWENQLHDLYLPRYNGRTIRRAKNIIFGGDFNARRGDDALGERNKALNNLMSVANLSKNNSKWPLMQDDLDKFYSDMTIIDHKKQNTEYSDHPLITVTVQIQEWS